MAFIKNRKRNKKFKKSNRTYLSFIIFIFSFERFNQKKKGVILLIEIDKNPKQKINQKKKRKFNRFIIYNINIYRVIYI